MALNNTDLPVWLNTNPKSDNSLLINNRLDTDGETEVYCSNFASQCFDISVLISKFKNNTSPIWLSANIKSLQINLLNFVKET
jgi:hypothetical protein